MSSVSDMHTDLARIHPDLPGEATVAEMFAMVWPFTAPVRRWLLLLIPLVLTLFGLTSIIPLLAGEGLQRAIAVERSERQVTDYLEQYRVLEAADYRLQFEDLDLTIPTEIVMARLPATINTIDSLFGDDPTRRVPPSVMEQVHTTIGEQIASGALPEVVQPLLERMTATDEVHRIDLEYLVNLVPLDQVDDIDIPILRPPDVVEEVPFDARAAMFDVVVRAMAEDEVLSDARTSSSLAALLRIVVAFIGVALAVAVIRLMASRIALSMMSSTGLALQRAVFRQVHDSALVDSGAVGRPSMISRCSTYIDTVESAIRAALITGVPATASLVLSLGFLIWISAPIGVAMTAVVLLLEIIRRRRAAIWSSRSRARLDRSTALSEHIDVAIADAPALRVSGGVPATRRRFDALATRFAESRRAVDLTGERLDVTATTIGQIGVATVIAVVGLAQGRIDIAQATAAVLYVGRVAESLAQLPALVAQLQDSAPTARRLRRVLLAAPIRPEPETGDTEHHDTEHDDTEPADPPPSTMVALQAVHASVPGRRPQLLRCTFDAPTGEWTVLTGPVRAETSLVIDLLAGQLCASSGRITVAGSEIDRWSAARFHTMVAVVPAAPAEFHGTVRDHLEPSTPAGEVHTPDHALLDALRECGLTSAVLPMPDGLETVLAQRDRPLAREARIRLAIARARLHQAPLVVIDDPTDMLDVDAAAEIWALMRRCFADRTVIAATHRLEMIDDHDQIVVIRNGKVAERGRRSQLMAAGGVFARWWSGSRAGGQMVWSELPGLEGLDEEAIETITGRLVTEAYEAGQVIAAAGDPAQQLYVIADGEVELLDHLGQRVTLCGPGDHFGSLDPDGPETLSATARAVEPTVVMSLHRSAVAGGAAGVLDRPPAQRLLFSWLSRHGSATRAELEAPDGPGCDAVAELDALVADRLIVVDRPDGDGPDVDRYRVVASRRRRRSSSLLGSLFGDD